MTRIAITIPAFMMPKKDLENPCPCQDKPIEMAFKKGLVFWLKQVGERVEKDELICEMEIEKKTAELPSPATGVLVEQTVTEEAEFTADSILGYLEVESA